MHYPLRLKTFSAILIVMLAFAVLPVQLVSADTTSSNPVSCANFGMGWTNPGNAVGSDNILATVANNNRNLDCSFNIVIPAGSTITNVEILPEGSTSNARQANVSISWDNGTNFSGTTLTTFTSTEGSITITPAGHSWTVAELTTILVRLNSNNGLGTLSIDNVVVRVTYTLPNTAPTVQSAITDVTVLEDTTNTVFSLYPNFQDAESADSALTYTVTSISNAALFTSPAGVLPIAIADPTNFTLDYAADANGISNVTIRATDSGGLFVEDTFQVTVTAVNDEPSFTAANPPAVNEDAGAQSVVGWVTAVDFGPADEDSSQAVSQYIVSNSTCGTLLSAGPSVSTIGTLTYTPASNQNGTCTFDLQVQDNGGTANSGDDTSPTQNFTITVNAIDDASDAVDDTATVNEDASATTINVRGNDNDIDGAVEAIQSVTQPTNGTVSITNGGLDLTYQPDVDYCNDGSPTDNFTYTLFGGDSATVAVTVTCVDDASVANDDTATVAEDSGPITINVRSNDSDGDSTVEAIQSVTQPANGTVGNFGTELTYEPNINYCNDGSPTDDFTYTLAGGDTATVAVTVTCVDDASVAADDTANVNEDASATTINVRGNDLDGDSAVEAIQSVTQPTNGAVVITNAGADLTYQPDVNYCNDGSPTDDFTYTLSGGDTATVAVTVTCVDDPSVAVDDTATVNEDSGATTINVRANDSDSDSTVEAIQSVTQPANGTVGNFGTELTYEPNINYCNDGSPTDDFTYTLSGGDTATVAVTVTCVDDASVAVDETSTVNEDASATTINVRGNDMDADSTVEAIQSVTQPTNGTVVNTNTDLSYQPDADYCNDGSPTDDFTYTLAGGDTATVAVTVTCANDASVANDDTATVNEDSSATTINVRSNDSDGDSAVEAIQSVTQPTNGTVVITNAGADLTYQPNADYCNDGSPTDDFTYTLSGGDTATVAVTVTCVGDASVGVDDTATVAEDSGATTIDVRSNDSDGDSAVEAIQSVTQPTNGTVVITNAGADLTYQPNADYCNDGSPTDDFTYTLAGGNTANVAVTVTCDLLIATLVSSSPDTGDGSVSENEIILDTFGVNQLIVEFSEDVYDPAGDSDADDVTNPANYILVRSATGTFATTGCIAGATAPDVTISVNSVTYNNNGGSGPYIATLNINGGFPLNVAGFYRLYVCGSTSIVEATDTTVALSGDGTNPGTDFIRNFRIQTQTSGGGGGGGSDDDSSTVSLTGVLIPVTGFTPNQVTDLPAQPADEVYAASSLRIEIPSLSLDLPIVGIDLKDKTFDITWLGNSAGYLEGSAYPTWRGNSVLTGHATDANGNPGPFAYINELKNGEKIYVHNNGFIYVYEVRENRRILPSGIHTLFKHKEDSWITLVTCENFEDNKFTHRRMVRAVLISIIPEK